VVLGGLSLFSAPAGETSNIIIGGFGSDDITLGSGTNVVLGDEGIVERMDGVVTAVRTLGARGAADIITSLGGFNVILGGAGGDRIAAPEGTNVILGDNGTVLFEDGEPAEVFTTDPLVGGDDSITGGSGDNVVLGGIGVDTITGARAPTF
jgi:mucin-19